MKLFAYSLIIFEDEFNCNNIVFVFIFFSTRARAEAEDARQKAKDDDDVSLLLGTVFLIAFDILGVPY